VVGVAALQAEFAQNAVAVGVEIGRGGARGGIIESAATRLIANLSEKVLLVACTDVASLWSAARVQQYLGESVNRERVGLVLNRFRKVPGFSEADAESAAGAKLLWRVPNQYFAISTAIDRGTPVMAQGHSEIARCFAGLAQELTSNDIDVKRTAWSLFKSV